MAPVLGYWNIRAIGEPIRCLLHYAGVEFEDKRYEMAPDYISSDWFSEKRTHGLDFPNLPYYIDGDIKITQSLAIMKHIARKHDLLGDTEEQKIRAEIVEQQANDYRWNLIRLILNPDFETEKQEFMKNLPAQFKLMDDFYGAGPGPWASGAKLTYADFVLYEVLNESLYLSSECLEGLDNLKDFHRKFEALPTVKSYHDSDKFKRWPLFGMVARFANKGEPLPKPVV